MSTSTPTSMWVSYLLASSSPWPAPMHPGGRYCIRYTSMHHAMYGAYLRIKINMERMHTVFKRQFCLSVCTR